MTKLKRFFCILLVILIVAPDIAVVAATTLENRDGSTNWYNWRNLQTFNGQPLIAPGSTGFHSMSMFANIDYKQDLEHFQTVTTQYPTDGRMEWFHEISEFIPVHYATDLEGHARPEISGSGVNAYDYTQENKVSKFDISLGQWMIHNNVLTRPNKEITVKKEGFGNQVSITPLTTSPFGVQNSLDLAERDEFVVNLSKAAFGPIESRPVLFEIDSWRYARAVLWHKIGTWYDGTCQTCIDTGTPRGWKWSGEWDLWEERDPNPLLSRAQSRPANLMEVTQKDNNYNQFYHQRVSKVGKGSWGNNDYEGWKRKQGDKFTPVCAYSAPSLYPAIGFVDYREEFITNPESYTAPVIDTYNRDYWVYTSTNVWELYIYELLSRGILDQNEIFQKSNTTRPKPLTQVGLETDNFAMEVKAAKEIEDIVAGWGRTIDGQLQFPVVAPELGVVMPNNPFNSTSLNIGTYALRNHTRTADNKLILSKTPVIADVLGRNYTVAGNTVKWNASTKPYRDAMGLPGDNLFQNQNLSVIAALRLIERVMRVEVSNMSQLEASIISHRYGARFLDTVAEEDRGTVEYLIAMGILDFEDFSEYSNLYNMLTREFSFVLLGRLANPSYRSQFSQILMTDAAGFSTLGDRNYQTYVRSSDADISRFVNDNGDLVNNPTVQTPKWYNKGGTNHLIVNRTREEEFSLLSDLYVVRVQEPSGTNQIKAENVEGSYRVTLNIDDPLKYLFLGMPLVLTSYNHKLSPYNTKTNTTKEGESNYGPLYIVTDQSNTLDYRNNMFQEYGLINLRPYPENRIRGQHPEFLSMIDSLLVRKSKGEDVWINGKTTYESGAGIGDQWFTPLPGNNSISQGILGVALKPDGRYIIEFVVPAPTAEVAVTFILNNMENRTHAMFAESEVEGIVTSSGQPMIQPGTALTDDITANGDIQQRKSDSIVVGSGVAISGGHITAGDYNIKGEAGNYLPYDYAVGGGANAAQDVIGKQPLLISDNKMLNSMNTTIKSISGTSNIRSKDWFDMPFINVSVSGINEFFTSDFTFKREVTVYVPSNSTIGRKPYETLLSPVHGQVFINFIPYQPTRTEQASLLSNQIDTSNHDWFFTKPTNPQLLEYWEYNIAVTQALLKTLGLPEKSIESGYYAPDITLLVSELEANKHLTNDFQRQFLEEVGKNLDPVWIKKWIENPSTFNKPAIQLDPYTVTRNPDTSKTLWVPRATSIKTEKVTVVDINGKEQVNASGAKIEVTPKQQLPVKSLGLDYTGTRFDIPFWAELYFYNNRGVNPTTVMQSNIGVPSVKSHLINSHEGPNRVFGTTTVQGLDDQPNITKNVFTPEYVLNGFDQIYVSQSLTNYSYQGGRYYNLAGSTQSYAGKKVYINNIPFIVAEQTSSELLLVSDFVLHGKVNDKGEIITTSPSESGIPVMEAGETWIKNQIGNLSTNTANMKLTYSFEPFNTFNSQLSLATTNELFIENGAFKIFRVSVDTDTSYVTRTPLLDTRDASVVYRPYVRLATSEWMVNPNGHISWSPSLNTNVGATAISNIVDKAQDTILSPESGNRVLLSSLKQTVVDIGGGSTIYVDNDSKVSLRIPYKEEFIGADKKIDIEAIYAYLDKNGMSTQVSADGNTYPISSYLQIKGVQNHVPTSSRYDLKTLVQLNGNYYQASPDGLMPWERVSWLSYVDLELERFQDFTVIQVVSQLGSEFLSRADSYQTARPLRPAVGQRSYAFSASLIPTITSLEEQVHTFEGVSDSSEFFEQIVGNFQYMRTRSFLSTLVWWIIALSLFIAVMIIVVRVGRTTPITYNLVEGWYSNTSIDFFAVFSVGIVRVDEKPRNWIEVVSYSVAIGVIPMALVMLFRAFGFNIL